VPAATVAVLLRYYSVVCFSELELMLSLNLVFHFMDVLCIALCTLVYLWITTGAVTLPDSDVNMLQGFREMCTGKVDTELGSEHYIAVKRFIE
jgi:hypothetical protein